MALASMQELTDKIASLMETYRFEKVFSYLGDLGQPGVKPFESLLEGSFKTNPAGIFPDHG